MPVKTTAEMIALVRDQNLSQEKVAELIDQWQIPQRPANYSPDDRDYDGAEFLHAQLVFGLNALDVRLGLKDFYGVRITQRGVLKLSKLTVAATADVIRQCKAGKRTSDAEWIH